MKTVKQLLRQPVKLVLLLLLAAMGVAMLTVCMGQYTATQLARAELDDKYDTVAVLSDEYFWSDKPSGGRVHLSALPEEIQQWVTETLAERTDLVKTESYPQLYSAYVPRARHDNISQYNVNVDAVEPTVGNGDPYRCAMLEVTLTQVGTVLYEYQYGGAVLVDGEWQEYEEIGSVAIMCAGTVERAISLEQGFPSPEGKTIALTLRVDSLETLNDLDLRAGDLYLVYGLDYNDVEEKNYTTADFLRRKQLEELFGPADRKTNMYRGQFDCMLTVCDYASLPALIVGGGVMELRSDLRQYHYLEEDRGQWVMQYRPAEEFVKKYTLPTVTALEGTAEDYLQTEEAALWRKALEEQEYNLHGFPVLAVEKVGYQLSFARDDARIVEGRDFTVEERIGVSRVCIISQAVAQASGLSVGDAIDLQTYWVDRNVGADNDNTRDAKEFPTAAIYSSQLGFSSEMESYTIVGLYRQNNAWQNTVFPDPYGFSPDTIFVPMGSISGDAITGNRDLFYTLVLQNGKMAEFQALQKEAGYPDLFICQDGGYVKILSNLNDFEGVSRKALLIGLAAYGVIMALLMVFVPLQQSRILATMGSLGVPRGRKIGCVLANALCILVPGSILGGLTGALLWEKIAVRLMETVNVSIPLEVDMAVTATALVALHLALMTVAVLLIAVPITGERSLIKRR